MRTNRTLYIIKSTSLLINQIGRDDGKEKIEGLEKTPGKKSLQGKTQVCRCMPVGATQALA